MEIQCLFFIFEPQCSMHDPMRITTIPFSGNSGGFAVQDLEDCQKEGSVIDPPLQELGGDTLAQARAAARAAVDALMLTDAPLLFPPGQLALAAMRSGCNKVAPSHKNPFDFFLVRQQQCSAQHKNWRELLCQLHCSLRTLLLLGNWTHPLSRKVECNVLVMLQLFSCTVDQE